MMEGEKRPCAWCGKLFELSRITHRFCCQECSAAAWYDTKVIHKPVPVSLRCPHSEHLVCEVHNCSRCGWNPVVAKARLADIIAKMEVNNG